jgi:ATP-binding cassette subfamily F protein 3
MNLLQLVSGAKHLGNKQLFSEAFLSVNADEHIGVIGPNGAGKTTLFKILAQLESLDEGQLIRSQSLRLGYLKQESEWNVEETVEQFISKDATKDIWDIKRWGPKLGIEEKLYQQPLKNLSGGYRMRVQLMKLLAQDPNLLLLDEPTNFLDLETTLILENFLQDYPGAFLLISHDREFLKRTTDHIVEVEQGEITKFPGNIEDYFEQKRELMEQLAAQARNQSAKRQHIMDFVERFRAKATKAKQAQSRLKQLDKMEVIETKPLPVRAQIPIPEPVYTGKETLLLTDFAVGYAENKILSGINFRLLKGDHLAVVGVNGAGKSTLLKTLAGKIPALGGQSAWGYQVKVSYFAQHSTDELISGETVLEALQRKAHREVTLQEIKNLAGALLFAGDDVLKKIKFLSGGEKSRVALGQVLLEKNPVLLLDEPTNHLDFDTVEALTQALKSYSGSILVVSHDRSFVRRVASRILEIHHGKAEFYPGSYDDYVWSQEQGVLSDRSLSTLSQAGGASAKQTSESKFNYRDEMKRLQSEANKLKKRELEILKAINDFSVQRDQLGVESERVSGAKAGEVFKAIAHATQKIDENENELLELMEQQQSVETQIQKLKS